MHYQIHLNNIQLPMLVEADTMEHVDNMLVLYKASTAVAAISLSELKCVIEVEASSVPPKDVFLDQQTELQTLKVEHKALQFKNNELWSDRRKAIDEHAEMSEELYKEKKSHKRTCWVLAIVCTVEVLLAISRALH